MKKSKITIEPATRERVMEFYGESPKSFKGYVAVLNSKAVGICGLSYEGEKILLFSDIKDELRPYKDDIWKAIAMVSEMVEKTNYPIVAVANKHEKNSEKILASMGFVPNGQSVPDGKIYWRNP